MKAIILGGTSGIGKSIVNRLEKVCDKVIGVGRKDVDTTSLKEILQKKIMVLMFWF